MKEKFINAYMETAKTFAKLSSAKRLQVGAIVVKDDRIVSIGYNGMPAGWDNTCEDKEYALGHAEAWLKNGMIDERWPLVEYQGEFNDQKVNYRLITKPEVLHAESNAISKLAKSSESGAGAALFVTHSPCLDCAKLIYQSGITVVYYHENYRDSKGIEFLKKSGIKVLQVQ